MSLYSYVWKALLTLSVDPFPTIAQNVAPLVDAIHMEVFNSDGLDQKLSNWIEEKILLSKKKKSNDNFIKIIPEQKKLNNTTYESQGGLIRSGSLSMSLKTLGSFIGLSLESTSRTPTKSSKISENRLSVSLDDSLQEESAKSGLTDKATFFDWSCEYFMEPQMKVLFNNYRYPNLKIQEV